MELSLLELLALLGVPAFLGCMLLCALGIRARTDRLAYPGWAWMAGALGIAGLETVRLLLGMESPVPVVGLGLVLAAGLGWRARARPTRTEETEEEVPGGRLESWGFGLVLVLVFALLAHRMLSSSLTAIVADDEANFWSLRAKYLYDAHSFGGSYAQALAQRSFNNANYPLLNSLLQLWTFDCAGRITHMANRIPIQLCSVALVLCTASALRRASRPWIAAVLLILLVTCAPIEAGIRRANADVLVAFAGLVAADAWRRGRRSPDLAWVGLASLAMAFLFWSKREGVLLGLCGALAIATVAWRRGTLARPRPPRAALPWIALPFAVLLGTIAHNLWFHARGSHELDPAILADVAARLGDDLPLVLRFLGDAFVRPSLNGIPAAFFALALLAHRARTGALAFVPLACLLFVLALIVALVRGNTEYLLKTACMRVLSQLVPLQLLWLAAVARELLAPAQDPDAHRLPREARSPGLG